MLKANCMFTDFIKKKLIFVLITADFNVLQNLFLQVISEFTIQ